MRIADQVQATIIANEPLNAGSMATGRGMMADSENPSSHFGKVIGYVPQTIQAGFTGQIIVAGLAENEFWNWQYGSPVFLNGLVLSDVAPTTGFSQQVGIAQSQTSVLIDLREPFLL